MPNNVEIKARLQNREFAVDVAKQLSDSDGERRVGAVECTPTGRA